VLSPWKTKTKKDFLNIIKNKEKNLSEVDILNTLVYPYIEPNNIFMNDAELQWVLINLRNISIDNNMKFLIECSNCNDDIVIECKLLDLCKYKENEYPTIKNNREWKDIDSLDALKNAIKNNKSEFPKNIEMLLHLDSANGEKFKNIEEKINYLDNLNLEEGNILSNEFKDIDSEIKLEYKTKCPHCEYKTNYIFEEIPDFFDPLLPKEL
jgi:hypothetical protein